MSADGRTVGTAAGATCLTCVKCNRRAHTIFHERFVDYNNGKLCHKCHKKMVDAQITLDDEFNELKKKDKRLKKADYTIKFEDFKKG